MRGIIQLQPLLWDLGHSTQPLVAYNSLLIFSALPKICALPHNISALAQINWRILHSHAAEIKCFDFSQYIIL